MAKPKAILANSIVPERGLRVWWLEFACPFCGKTWARGGHKEGFVKSAANNHVAACWEIVLFDQGYLLGPFLQTRGRTVVPLSGPLLDWQKRNRRSVMALRRSRINAGLTPRKPA